MSEFIKLCMKKTLQVKNIYLLLYKNLYAIDIFKYPVCINQTT